MEKAEHIRGLTELINGTVVGVISEDGTLGLTIERDGMIYELLFAMH